MGKASCCCTLAIALTFLLLAVAEEKANKTSLGGIFWATGEVESDLLSALEAEDPSAVDRDSDDLAGGFSSLDSMLQWAIGHSDPEKLKEKASDVQRLSANELKKRQLEIKELMERLKTPSDAELMQIAIADLNNSSSSLEDRHRALDELLVLVDPIDNANGYWRSRSGGVFLFLLVWPKLGRYYFQPLVKVFPLWSLLGGIPRLLPRAPRKTGSRLSSLEMVALLSSGLMFEEEGDPLTCIAILLAWDLRDGLVLGCFRFVVVLVFIGLVSRGSSSGRCGCIRTGDV